MCAAIRPFARSQIFDAKVARMTIIIKSCVCADVHDDYLPLLKICDLSVCWGYYTPFWNACQGFLRIFENLGVIFVFFMGFMHGFHGVIGIL